MPDISSDARITSAVIDAHLKKGVDPIFTRNPIAAMMKEKGKLSFRKDLEHIGKTFKWRVRYKRRSTHSGDAVAPSYNFQKVNTHREASLGWRHMWITEMTTRLEELLSQNPDTAWGKILNEVVKEATEDFMADFPRTFFNDGNATGDTEPHGIESFMANSGALANGFVGSPNDLYAGLYTNLAYYGGAWNPPASSAWPLATDSGCSPTYHFWSPLIIDTTNALWSTGTDTWAGSWQEQLMFAQTYMGNIQDTDIDLFLIHSEMMRQAKASVQGLQTFEVTQNSPLTKLGFKTLNYDGVELMAGHGVPAGVGYGLTFDNIELLSLQDQLLATEKDYDIETSSKRHLFTFYGNWKFKSPAKFVKFVAIT